MKVQAIPFLPEILSKLQTGMRFLKSISQSSSNKKNKLDLNRKLWYRAEVLKPI
jgi:hypothetical protein